uniref:Uncharacterized protein n=1 Tax=virus sp. ctBM815 TaxID=2825806 RepID=A0A8S5RJN6_9VIRU|nr:MAG TPA: hypothetical protein [virus sp. ctBM815]
MSFIRIWIIYYTLHKISKVLEYCVSIIFISIFVSIQNPFVVPFYFLSISTKRKVYRTSIIICCLNLWSKVK